MSGITELTSGEFTSFTTKGLAVVDFWAPWCGPCKRLGPIFQKLAGEMTTVKFGKVNTDENQELAGSHGIMSIPTLQIWKDGKLVDSMIGAYPEDQLRAFITKYQ